MRVAIVTGGTEGDIQPMLAVGRGLRARGHAVRFAAAAAYHDLITASGLSPFALEGDDPRHVVADIARRNPDRSRLKTLRGMLKPVPPTDASLRSLVLACENVDAVLYTPISGLAYHVADARRVPSFEVHLIPLTPTREFPSPHWPWPAGFVGPYNFLSHHAIHQFFWQINRFWVNDWRRNALGASPLPFEGPIGTRYFREMRRVVCAVSPSVVPKPRDWSDTVGITGYLFAASDGYVPPAALAAFVEAGEPPVCVGFGSTVEGSPGALRPIFEATQKLTRRRFVFVRGWANYDLPEPSSDVFVVDRASYAWLYPRASAVVHHAGTGTAAEAVRAGVPSVAVPYITEQRFWAARLSALGVAPPEITRRGLTATRLADAINAACTDASLRRRARTLGTSVRSEDGASGAVDFVEREMSRGYR
jgi:UDP:flavonoid glycosyltransferase YjiC (YdhE family)